MGQKVIYVDCEGNRFDAEINGPVAEIHKPKLKKIGKDQYVLADENKPGEIILKPGQQLVGGQTARENRTRPYVNLRVNFGSEAHPRHGDVTGVRLQSQLDKTHRKAYYYEPIIESVQAEEPATPEVPAEPKTAKPPKPAKPK